MASKTQSEFELLTLLQSELIRFLIQMIEIQKKLEKRIEILEKEPKK